MNILFLGCLFKKSEENTLLFKSKIGLQSQANSYQWALIDGLDFHNVKPVSIINVVPVGTYPNYYADLILKTNKWNHVDNASDIEIGSINIVFLKQITRAIKCVSLVKKWIKNNDTNSNNCIIVYSTYLPFLYALKKLPSNIRVILIVTDLPQYYDLTQNAGRLKQYIRIIYNKLIYYYLKRVDGFVLVAENMKHKISINNRPYVIIEGVVDDHVGKNIIENQKNPNAVAILYTGTLNYKFGIMELISAFMLIKKHEYELWICGSGEAENDIKYSCNYDNRIKYFGFLSKSKIYELQQRSTILINPRPNNQDYTKYSFPSKTLEYMMSARPVLMYKLDGIPSEYDQYLYYISGNDPKSMAESIINVCEKSKLELDLFGKKARDYVISNKNHIVQAKKIIDMLENNFNNKC